MAEKPVPTHADVSYGAHDKNVFDIWITPLDNPTPLVIYIHGGGFRKGNKNTITEDSLKQFQEAGLSLIREPLKVSFNRLIECSRANSVNVRQVTI